MGFGAEQDDAGLRLDVFLQEKLKDRSRSAVGNLIKDGRVLVNGRREKTGYRMRSGDGVIVTIVDPQPTDLTPWDHPLDILYEDRSLLVVNKPPGLVVHPAPGHWNETLVNALLGRAGDLSGGSDVLRPGIVHRLDRDTSGVLLVAKDDRAHVRLAGQFKAGTIEKRYLALVYGVPDVQGGTIDAPIGRHPVDRKRMTVRPTSGRRAVTVWRLDERFDAGMSLLQVDLKTGRTHQIRVHMAEAGHPVMGDPVYGGRRASPATLHDERLRTLICRQMLHAWKTAFDHPVSGERMRFEAPIPEDMGRVLDVLRGNL